MMYLDGVACTVASTLSMQVESTASIFQPYILTSYKTHQPLHCGRGRMCLLKTVESIMYFQLPRGSRRGIHMFMNVCRILSFPQHIDQCNSLKTLTRYYKR